MRVRRYSLTSMSLKSPSIIAANLVLHHHDNDGITEEGLLAVAASCQAFRGKFPPQLCKQMRVLVSNVFLSETVRGRAGVWALVGARHAMDLHLLDLDHQPTPEPALQLSSWKLVCYSEVLYRSFSFSSTSTVSITDIPPSFAQKTHI